jgi:AraC-like DNA-binding protein
MTVVRSHPAPAPLARFEQLHTTDLERAHAVVSEAFCPHQLLPLSADRQVDARFHAVRFGRIGLYYLDYGRSVRIEPRPLTSFFLLQIPLAGEAVIRNRGREIHSSPELASLPSPDDELVMRWGENNPQLIVWIDRAQLEGHLSAMIDRPLTRPIDFELGVATQVPTARSWRRVVDLLLDDLDCEDGIGASPIAVADVERLLLSRLLLAQPNNYTDLLHRDPPRVAPRPIRHAADLIEAHAAEPLGVEDIAEAVGLSVRALQEGFRRHLDTTPMKHLREVRLGLVRNELAEADPTAVTVTDIALKWGFLQTGRFAVQYRERFGESPSTTLRR